MAENVIEVRGLGKRYRIGERERYVALRDVLTRAFAAPFRRDGKRRQRDYLWALRDVNLGIRQGEVVGLIGRNGSGKTTLLKVLSRITRPTTGYAEVRGRVGSLLEVGTGFHPELTGRENIYLSGAILGMSKKEINERFDAIVAFSGVERFLDTPLKHFSSGMQMRLAFAVAAHLDPEILLVDEVLAVGDLEFQKKCLGKMEDISHSSRTIVFVSHQMNQIRRLCRRVLWLDGGQIRMEGSAAEVIGAYEAAMMTPPQGGEHSGAPQVFRSWEFAGKANILKDGLRETTLSFVICPEKPIRGGHFGMHIYNDTNVLVASWGFDEVSVEAGLGQLRVTLPYLPLQPGTYAIVCSLFDGGNSFTGGNVLEVWNAAPLLTVDTLPLTHQLDEWAGIFNIPAELTVCAHAGVAQGAREPNVQARGDAAVTDMACGPEIARRE